MKKPERTILLIEDSPEERATIRRALATDPAFNYTILEAATGIEGVRLWRERQPDCVLLDDQLPDIEGLTLVTTLNPDALNPDVPVIMMIGAGNESLAVQALKGGTQVYLVKGKSLPIELHLAIHQAMDLVALRRQHKQAEEALHQNRTRLAWALEQAKIYFWETDAVNGQVVWSDNAALVLGFPPALIPKTVEEIWAFSHPDDRARTQFEMEKVLSGQQPAFRFEHRFVHPTDHSIVWIKAQGAAEEMRDGKPIRIVGLSQNITERKLAEQALAKQAAIIINSVDAIISKDLNGIITSWNKSAERIFGYTEAEAIGQSVTMLMPPQVVHEEQGILERLKQGETIEQYETLRRRKDGSDIDVSLTVSPIRDEHGKIVGASKIARNITERKRAEEQLKFAATRIEIAQEAARAMLYEFIPQTGEVIYNASFASLIGCAPDEIPTHADSWKSLIHPDDLAITWEVILKGIKSGTGFTLEYRVRHKAGHYLWLHDRARMLQNEQGQVKRAVGMIIDITERKQSEKSLQQSEFRYHSLFETIDQGFCVIEILFDQNGKPFNYLFVETNPMFARHTGFNDVSGKTVLELIPQLETHWFETYGKVVLTGESVRLIERSDAMNRWFEVYAMRLGDQSSRQVAVLFTDITERKQQELELHENEEHLRLATEAAEMYSWVIDLPHRTIKFAANQLQVLGFELPETFSEAMKFVHPEDGADAKRAFNAEIQNTENFETEYRLIHPNTGEVVWVCTTGVVITDANSAPVRLVGVTQNISSRKLAEAERERLLAEEHLARQTAEAATRAKDEFLAIISHELRNPLNSILGYSRLVCTNPHDAAQVTSYCKIIERNARVQQQLIEDLLDTARIISGKLRIEVAPTDLRLVLEDALAVVRPAADAKRIDLIAHLGDKSQTITGDAARLQQVVWNLLQNAIKFTPEGGRVELELERGEKNVRVIISDSGQGIDPEFLPIVFDRFSQNDMSRTRRHGGLGLGLALVKQLVELHGGTVKAASAGTGQGATFMLTLPLGSRQIVDLPSPLRPAIWINHEPEAMPLNELPRLDGVRVLVVDDDVETRLLLTTALNICGGVVISAASGQAAYALLNEMEFDVLVCDIAMPDEDGYQVIRKIRALESQRGIPLRKRLPAVALTALSRSEDRLQALGAGFQMHVSKPVELAELVVVIHSLFNNSSREARK